MVKSTKRVPKKSKTKKGESDEDSEEEQDEDKDESGDEGVSEQDNGSSSDGKYKHLTTILAIQLIISGKLRWDTEQ